MIEVHKYLEGRTVDGRYPLVELLGATARSSVFRTECREAPQGFAAIKLIPAPAASSGAQLTRWRLGARLSHPALLRIFDMGRCEIEGRAMLHAVMELAEENLGEVLGVRPLSPGETRLMLAPALEALAYLHSKGLVHGHLRPSNILATGDQVKLSSDSIARIGEMTGAGDTHDPYHAPEASLSAASDVWSLAATVIQCLTGRVPERGAEGRNVISIPADVPPPFADWVRRCLNPVPQRRWSVAQFQAALGRGSSVAVRSATASSVQNPEDNEPHTAAEKPGTAVELPSPATRKDSGASDPAPAPTLRKTAAVALSRLRFRIALKKQHRLALAALLATAAAFALGIVIAGSGSDDGVVASAPATTSAAIAKPDMAANPSAIGAEAEARVDSAPKKQNHDVAMLKSKGISPESKAVIGEARISGAPTGRAGNQSSAVIVTSVPPAVPAEPAESGPTVSGDLVPGAVSRRAVPRVPTSASNTIWGTVRVSVIVDVDPRGRVVEAKLDSAGPSRYFAGLSMAAAQDWKFTPPRVDGNIVPSEWIIDFGYSKSDTSATAAERHP